MPSGPVISTPLVAVLGWLGQEPAVRLDVVELQTEAGQVELDVLGQRRVAGRKNEAVAADGGRPGRRSLTLL